MAAATYSVVIDTSADAFYDLITDFESYPSFVPNQSGARVLDEEEERWRVEFELSVAKRLNYVLDLDGKRGAYLRWAFVEGDMMREMSGGWEIEALAAEKIRATYTIDVALKGFVPRSISRALVERTLPSNMDAFKREAERRRG